MRGADKRWEVGKRESAPSTLDSIGDQQGWHEDCFPGIWNTQAFRIDFGTFRSCIGAYLKKNSTLGSWPGIELQGRREWQP